MKKDNALRDLLMKEELWLKQIKERLDDYTEPLPVAGWERLEQDLSSDLNSCVPHVVPFYRRWSVAAAAVLLLAVSSVSIWLMQSSLKQDIRQAAVAISAVNNSELFVGEHTSLPFSGQSPVHQQIERQSVSPYTRQSVVLNQDVVCQEMVVAPQYGNMSATDREGFVGDEESLTKEVALTQESDSSKKEELYKPRYRPSSRDKYHLPAADKSASAKGWSLALSVGNTGGFSSLESSASRAQMHQSSAVLSNDGLFDLSATAQDIFYIPDGQDLVFNEGIPVLKGASRQVVSVDHHQPVSVGFSLRKMLSKGFSLETGIQYTYLVSDIALRSGEELKQKLHYLGIPLRVNWSFFRKERLDLYVSAGGTVEKCIYGKFGSESHTVKPLQLSVLGAVGAQLNLSRKVGLYVEPGVSYFFDDGSQVETIRKENPCNFTLQGGIRFTY